jgi:hypothetical protein
MSEKRGGMKAWNERACNEAKIPPEKFKRIKARYAEKKRYIKSTYGKEIPPLNEILARVGPPPDPDTEYYNYALMTYKDYLTDLTTLDFFWKRICSPKLIDIVSADYPGIDREEIGKHLDKLPSAELLKAAKHQSNLRFAMKELRAKYKDVIGTVKGTYKVLSQDYGRVCKGGPMENVFAVQCVYCGKITTKRASLFVKGKQTKCGNCARNIMHHRKQYVSPECDPMVHRQDSSLNISYLWPESIETVSAYSMISAYRTYDLVNAVIDHNMTDEQVKDVFGEGYL